MTAEERFWAKVNKTDACWRWTAGLFENGYGAFHVDGRTIRAHRYAYELLVGPIPAGLMLDHLCRTRCCVNPAHLEPVTNRENQRRGVHGCKTHCPHGHRYDAVKADGRRRRCRACARRASLAYYYRTR